MDRTALGQQAIDAFNEAPLEQNHALENIQCSRLRDMAAEAETRVQVATVQAMVKRIFMVTIRHPSINSIALSSTKLTEVTLDQEMTEGELPPVIPVSIYQVIAAF